MRFNKIGLLAACEWQTLKVEVVVLPVCVCGQRLYFLKGGLRTLPVVDHDAEVKNLKQWRALLQLEPAERDLVQERNLLAVACVHFGAPLSFVYVSLSDHQAVQSRAEIEEILALGDLDVAVSQPGPKPSHLE